MRAARILIYGGFGPFHNLGDEAILRSAAARLRKIGGVTLTVGVDDPDAAPSIEGCSFALGVAGYLLAGARNSRVPRARRIVRGAVWRVRYLLRAAALCGVIALPRLAPLLARGRGRLGAVLRPLVENDAVLFVGGGYLNSRWVSSSLQPSAIQSALARRLRVPLYLTGQGLGPFRTRWHRFLIGVLLRGARLIGVRDYGHDSLRLLRDLGVPGGVVRFLPDDAHGLVGSGGVARRRRARPSDPIVIGVNWRSQAYDTRAEEAGLIRLILAIAAKRSVEVRLVPMLIGPGGDASCDARIAEQLNRMGVPAAVRPPGLEGVPAALAGCDVVLGGTYHLVVLALDSGVPAMGFVRGSYSEQKMRPLVSSFGFPQWAVSIERLTSGGPDLPRLVEDAIEGGEELRERLRERAREKSEALDRGYREMLDEMNRGARCRRSG